ncbi:uncharacterized protein LOC119394053 [Rhipicephalus sanguineus]|uniref:uncharacterized protein LOC119394053 n=1 Tax=Rhipicephalus sanguineus TaxID=34632 RepID=UPI001892E78E|nr:uncharacterized protein LOC119394053 [Rhipicephalus sanguineus]
MGPVVVLVAMLCITSVAAQSTTEEPLTVDAVIDQLKDMVKEFVPDKVKAEMLVEKIESTRVCFNMTEGIRDEIVKKLIGSMVPSMTECAKRTKDIANPVEKQSAVKECFAEQARQFMESNGMTQDEIAIFAKMGKCIKENAQL